MAISLLDFANQTKAPMKRGLVQQVTNESIFLRRLRFIPVDGMAYSYSRQVGLGGIAFRGLNASYTNDVGVINPMVETLSIFGGEVRTDRQLVNKQGDRPRANAIAAKVKKAGLFFDKYVLQGNPATDPLQFYGLNARLTGAQVLSAGTNGGTLTLDLVDRALDQVVGPNENKIIVCNKALRRKITNLAVGSAGGAAVLDVGHQRKEYNGAPIEVLDEDGDEAAILGFTETQGSSNVCTSLYVIALGSDVDEERCQGLIGSDTIEHAEVGLQGTYFTDIVEANMGLGLFHPRAAARIQGITNT
jgi:hypothetical protein